MPLRSSFAAVLAPMPRTPHDPPRFSGPDDVSAEGIAALMEAALLDEDADALDPRRVVDTVTDTDTLDRLPDRHPAKLRASAVALRQHGQELLDVAKAWRELRAGVRPAD